VFEEIFTGKMAVELTFSKPDSGAHWGFRLVGGADFDEPLVVVKVNFP